MHYEVRVRRHGNLWEVRPGAYGRPQFYGCESIALTRARLAAQLAWSDRQVPACVTVLARDGAWRIDAAFGPAPRPDVAARDLDELPS